VIDAFGGDPRLGICLDTQHAFASGIGYGTIEAADAMVAAIDRTIGLDKLGLIHLNDSKVAFASNRDRHENLGEGEIGASALACLLGHPALDAVTAVLEVPGDGDGPRASDMDRARAIYAEGLAARA
jgi:deoxyribonuclease-4